MEAVIFNYKRPPLLLPRPVTEMLPEAVPGTTPVKKEVPHAAAVSPAPVPPRCPAPSSAVLR